MNLSYTQAYQYRVKTSHKGAVDIKKNWKPPQKALLHWDGKMMQTLDVGNELEDRMPVLVSGIGGTKLLGVPSIPKKSGGNAGQLVSGATVKLLNEWNCSDKIIGMVFDTTPSNTDCMTAACVSIQNRMSQPLLWVACRHHIGEVVLDHGDRDSQRT